MFFTFLVVFFGCDAVNVVVSKLEKLKVVCVDPFVFYLLLFVLIFSKSCLVTKGHFHWHANTFADQAATGDV